MPMGQAKEFELAQKYSNDIISLLAKKRVSERLAAFSALMAAAGICKRGDLEKKYFIDYCGAVWEHCDVRAR